MGREYLNLFLLQGLRLHFLLRNQSCFPTISQGKDMLSPPSRPLWGHTRPPRPPLMYTYQNVVFSQLLFSGLALLHSALPFPGPCWASQICPSPQRAVRDSFSTARVVEVGCAQLSSPPSVCVCVCCGVGTERRGLIFLG